MPWGCTRSGSSFVIQTKEMLQIRTSGEKDSPNVEIDLYGRMQLPSEFSAKFKNETVVVFWKDDHVKVMLYTAYKRIISATIPEDGFPACHRKGGRGG